MRGEAQIDKVARAALANINAPRNVLKGSWRDLSVTRLFWHLLVEVYELLQALRELHALRRRYNRIPLFEIEARRDMGAQILKAREEVKHECGDCVAFLAFIVDKI